MPSNEKHLNSGNRHVILGLLLGLCLIRPVVQTHKWVDVVCKEARIEKCHVFYL